MKKYNILYIEDSVGVGGSLVSLCLLLESLNRQKYRPYSILFHNSQELYLKNRVKDIETIVARPGVSLKASILGKVIIKCASLLGKRSKQIGSFLIFFADFLVVLLPYAFRLYFTVRRWNIHLVHLNTGICRPGIILAMLLRTPCIATQRGPEWPSPIINLFSKFILLFIAISETSKRDLLNLGVESSKIKIINPPVNMNIFDFTIDCAERRKEFHLKSDEVTFGIIGVLAEWKGHKCFLRAAAKVLKVIPNCKVFVVGDTPNGTTKYKDELVAFTERLGIREKLIFTGFRKDVPEIIQLLDVVVHSSILPEPFGKIIIEGMAMKKPVIASQAGGPTEIIKDGHNGFFVPPNNSEKLAEKIITLLLNNELRKKIGEAGWQNVNANFVIEKHVKMVEKIYDTILY